MGELLGIVGKEIVVGGKGEIKEWSEVSGFVG